MEFLCETRFRRYYYAPRYCMAGDYRLEDAENLSDTDFRGELMNVYPIFRHFRIERLFTDAWELRVPFDYELQDWFEAEMAPRLRQIGLKKWAVLAGDDFFVWASFEQMFEETDVRRYFGARVFHKRADAMAWLLEPAA